MVRQGLPQRDRSALVEKYAHSGGSQCTPRGVLQDRANLLQRYAREPLHKLGHQRTVFKIFKQRCHGHAGTTEYPSAADAFRVALDRWTGGPVNHGEMLPPPDEDGRTTGFNARRSRRVAVGCADLRMP